MPPKKAAVVSTGDPELSPKDAPEDGKKAKKPDAVVVRKLSSHPSTIIMVKEAIKALDSRKGVSSQAIQGYIKQHYPSVDVVKLKHLVRRALIKGQDNGTLVRPANSTMTVGAQGKFRLAQKLREAKPKSENTDPNLAKATKKAKDEKKPSKAGATKVKDVPSLKTESSEDEKPSKTTIKENLTSKVPPVKKAKAKKTENESSDKTSGETKAPLTKTGKATTSKTTKTSTDDSSAKATRTRGRKTVE